MEDQRFVVVASDLAEIDDIAHAPDVLVLDRLDVVVLLRTTPERSRELSSRPGAVVSVYATESLARMAFEPFRHRPGRPASW
ncbi:MAG TPA: hypothetical protein VE646_11335 [Actinomycetota bacterium]|jgi:hypothetical protein|nr:hypothetical protein [Actinomycetota bacterium]